MLRDFVMQGWHFTIYFYVNNLVHAIAQDILQDLLHMSAISIFHDAHIT
jgi:hypothetical protein